MKRLHSAGGSFVFLFLWLIIGASCAGSGNPDDYGEVFSFEENLKLGKQYYQKGDFQMAKGHFESAREKRPENFDAAIHLANSYYQIGKNNLSSAVKEGKDMPEDARKYLDRTHVLAEIAAKLNPESPQPYFLKGRMYFDFHPSNAEFLGKARKQFNKALARIPEGENPAQLARVHFYLGGVATFSGNYEKGKKHLSKYLSIFDELGVKPPKEKEVEDLLMKIEQNL